MALSDQTVVMVHLQHGFDLGHGVEIDAHQDEKRRSSEQICQFAREFEQLLNQARYQRDEGQIQRAGKDDPVQDPGEIFLHLFASDNGY